MLGVMLATLSYGEKHLVALFYLLLDFKNGEGRTAERIGQNFKHHSLFYDNSAEQLLRYVKHRKHLGGRTSLFCLSGYLTGDDRIAGNSALQLSAAYKAILTC